MDLRATLEIREAEAVDVEAVAEEAVARTESGERQEEKSQKIVILKKVCTEAQKADNKPTYGMPFNLAEDVNAFVSPTRIVYEIIPSANIIPSRDTSPIARIEAPTVDWTSTFHSRGNLFRGLTPSLTDSVDRGEFDMPPFGLIGYSQ
jgi:hypothetical protein